ncbi:MAG: rhodanese-like domain-containing protein [Planctomycetota bacterium]
MKTIDKEHLADMQKSREDLVVLEVLGEDDYKRYHLPGAINVPLDEGFAKSIQEAVPEKDRPIVVYCTDEECPASGKAARWMESLGYTDVYDYTGGKKDWQATGGKLVAGPTPG